MAISVLYFRKLLARKVELSLVQTHAFFLGGGHESISSLSNCGLNNRVDRLL